MNKLIYHNTKSYRPSAKDFSSANNCFDSNSCRIYIYIEPDDPPTMSAAIRIERPYRQKKAILVHSESPIAKNPV